MIVMDASAALRLCIDGTAEAAATVFANEGRIIAPTLFRVEVAQAAWKYVHVGAYEHNEAKLLLEHALGCIDEFVDDGELLGEALAVASRLDHSLYDVLYFALARRSSATLMTCDRRLAGLCRENDVECVELVDL